MKPDLAPALVECARRLLRALLAREWEIDEHQIQTRFRVCTEQGDGRPYSAHAAARNAMLDLYLKPEHTHVLWIDADVVDYPADLATRLHAADSDGIVAPLVLIEGSTRFYDVYGFVDSKGRRMEKPYPPYMDMSVMSSVGTCYLCPASVYHAGARYGPVEGHTEHYSVCAKAGRVSVAGDVVVYHADLPRWGQEWNTL
jgi:Anp1.